MDFFKVFYAPREVKYTNKKWIYFTLLALVIALLVLFFNVHFNFQEIMNTIKERLSSGRGGVAVITPGSKGTKNAFVITPGMLLVRGSISLLLGIPLKLLFMAAIFYVIRMFWEAENFAIPLFASSVYIYVQTVGDFIKFLLSIIFKTFPFSTDLSLLISNKNFLFGFLSVFDLFTIYAMYIVGVVLSGGEKKRTTSYFLVLLGILTLWGVVKGILIGMGMK